MAENNTINILYLVDGMPSGGAERQLVELLKGLRTCKGYVTTLVTLSSGGDREIEAQCAADYSFRLTSAANAGIDLSWRFPFALIRLLFKEIKPSSHIVHSFGCFADHLGVAYSKKFGVPFINGSIRAARPKLNFRDRISSLTFSHASDIVANSYAGLVSFGVEKHGRVIHNGVDLERFNNVHAFPLKASPMLCMVGNFTDKKDQASLIACVPKLAELYPGLHVVLIGGGKNLGKTMAYADKLDCRKLITFVEGCMHPEPYIAASDVCLLLTNKSVHGEGISNAIIEYMALQKPVIATDCGGSAELVLNGVNGILLPDNNSSLLLDALNSLLKDDVQRHRMGMSGRQRVEEAFSLQRMVNDYRSLYEEAVRSNGDN